MEGTPSAPPRRSQGQGSARLAASRASPHGRLPLLRALEWLSGQGSGSQRGQGPPFRPPSYHRKPESPRASGHSHEVTHWCGDRTLPSGTLGPTQAQRCAGGHWVYLGFWKLQQAPHTVILGLAVWPWLLALRSFVP